MNCFNSIKFYSLSDKGPFSGSGADLGSHDAFVHLVPLANCHLRQLFGISLSSMTLTLWKSIGELFCGLSLGLVF